MAAINRKSSRKRPPKPIDELRRSIMSCMLWENEFYEDGVDIAQRISDLAKLVDTSELAKLSVTLRKEHSLRHAPLLLLLELIRRGGRAAGQSIYETVQRPDELAELLSLYWLKGKRPLSSQLKLGLARALRKFDAYKLAKYRGDGKAISLRDVMFLAHPKPKDASQAETFKLLAANELPTPDTWEAALSAGKDKKETWERLIREGKLGYFALIRNLRNMVSADVDPAVVREALLARKGGAEKILPFRYIAAARAAPRFEPELDISMGEALKLLPPLQGETLVLVDVSGSMDRQLSDKSDLKRIDAAAALAVLIPGTSRVFSFSDRVVEVPPRKGIAGIDVIQKSQRHSGTRLDLAVGEMNGIKADRLIVVTDEQNTGGQVPNPIHENAYMINVASYRNGIDYGDWTRINGFSENVIRWISEYERPFESEE